MLNTLDNRLHRGLIKISGVDAEKFLQGQLTCDVKTIASDATTTQSCLGAHCNVKGRIVFTFRLFYSDGSYFLSLPKTQVEYAIQSLKKYAVFSKVSIEDVSETVSTINPEQKIADIEAGIAEIYPETREQFTPHELNYHQLGAISFDKGCYIGQEIVARMHYLGKLKSTLVLATLSTTTPPTRGEKIFYGEQEKPELAGYLVDYAHINKDQYKLLIILYNQAENEALWVGDGLAN